ncbi:MAG: hypothetical protein H7Z16_01870 [Pyrinomonadaceae bacterium]|nr:hypothetical protein [Pyrinomonadaceae bacterium]
MPKLEFILVLLVSFQISALAHFLISKLSNNSIVKALISFAVGVCSILILVPIIEQYTVPQGYRNGFGFVVIGTLVSGVFVFVLTWVRGGLEGEGLAYKSAVFARATIFFLTLFLFASYLIIRGRGSWSTMLIYLGLIFTLGFLVTKRKRLHPWKRRVAWETDYYLTVALSSFVFLAPTILRGRTQLSAVLSGVLLAIALTVLARGYSRRRKQSFMTDSISYRPGNDFDRLESKFNPSHVDALSRIALIRIVLLALVAVPVFFVSGTPGRVGVSGALIIYIVLEGLVIRSHGRIVARAIHLTHRIGP